MPQHRPIQRKRGSHEPDLIGHPAQGIVDAAIAAQQRNAAEPLRRARHRVAMVWHDDLKRNARLDQMVAQQAWTLRRVVLEHKKRIHIQGPRPGEPSVAEPPI